MVSGLESVSVTSERWVVGTCFVFILNFYPGKSLLNCGLTQANQKTASHFLVYFLHLGTLCINGIQYSTHNESFKFLNNNTWLIILNKI